MEDGGLVALVVALSALVHHAYMSFGVVQARKRFGIHYPALYADAENCKNEEHRNKFNCTQRAHQNSLEYQPIFLAMLITAGTQFPRAASAFGALFLAGRVVYFSSYSTGVPRKRYNGNFGMIGLVGLLVLCITIGVRGVRQLS